MYIYIYIYVYVYLYIYMYTYVYIHVCICKYIHIIVCTYVRVYIYICIFMCDITHSYRPLLKKNWNPIRGCKIQIQSKQKSDSMRTKILWLIYMCDMTHLYVWHDSCICVTWLIHICDMIHSYVWHDSFLCRTWLIRTHFQQNKKKSKLTWCQIKMWCQIKIKSKQNIPIMLELEKKFNDQVMSRVGWVMSYVECVWNHTFTPPFPKNKPHIDAAK